MRILTPDTIDSFDKLTDAIFLAGPCPRSADEGDWRDEAFEIFRERGFKGDIISPTNRSFTDESYEAQLDWEYDGLCYASAIMFWIPRTEDTPGFTTNIEFGEWLHSDSIVLGFPEGAYKTRYNIHIDLFKMLI